MFHYHFPLTKIYLKFKQVNYYFTWILPYVKKSHASSDWTSWSVPDHPCIQVITWSLIVQGRSKARVGAIFKPRRTTALTCTHRRSQAYIVDVAVGLYFKERPDRCEWRYTFLGPYSWVISTWQRRPCPRKLGYSFRMCNKVSFEQ